jgi:hypothetical protein
MEHRQNYVKEYFLIDLIRPSATFSTPWRREAWAVPDFWTLGIHRAIPSPRMWRRCPKGADEVF